MAFPKGWEWVEGQLHYNKVRASDIEPRKPSDYQVDGPKSCENYYQACACRKCEARDRWYTNEAT